MITDTLVVVNPASGGGRTYRRWSDTAALLLAAGIDFETHLTRGPADATTRVRDALQEGCRRVIAVGGDGTLNEVVDGFFAADGTWLGEDATLAVIPSGTGGDFRKTARIPASAAAAVDLIAAGHERRIDAGRIEYDDGTRRHFVNIADCGVGGEVVARVNRSTQKRGGLRGTAVFLAASLTTLWTFRPRHVRLDIDGDISHHEVESVVVANGCYFGAGMRIAPDALLDDGKFDVVIVEARSHVRALQGIPSLYRGTHLSQPGVIVRHAQRVRIESADDDMLFDVEGEQVGRTPATLTCLPGAIRLCAPLAAQ